MNKYSKLAVLSFDTFQRNLATMSFSYPQNIIQSQPEASRTSIPASARCRSTFVLFEYLTLVFQGNSAARIEYLYFKFVRKLSRLECIFYLLTRILHGIVNQIAERFFQKLFIRINGICLQIPFIDNMLHCFCLILLGKVFQHRTKATCFFF